MNQHRGGRKVLVAGATGLVGRELVSTLLREPSVDEVRQLVRRNPGVNAPKLQSVIADFDRLDEVRESFGVEAVFCALGTTIREAGSQEAFRRVDYEYPLAVARLAIEQGVKQFLLVSAAGADPSSRVFYSRVKGELEEALSGMGFHSLTIARPSLLLGDRKQQRLGEMVGKWLALLAPPQYRAVHARQVARGLVDAYLADNRGRHVLDNRSLRQL